MSTVHMLSRRGILTGALIGAIGSAMSAGIHSAFDYAGWFTTAPWLISIIAAHVVFVGEVGDAVTRRTSAGRWAGLTYFAVYLVFLIGIYGWNFSEIGLTDAGNVSHDAWTGIYFSAITWTTVGYGDVTAAQPAARFFAAMEALNSYLVLTLFIAALVPVFQRLLQETTDQADGGGPRD